MGAFRDFLDNLFGDHSSFNNLSACEKAILSKAEKLWYMQLAQHIVAERYGSLLSKCEFKTYIKNSEEKKDNYYLLNVEPNPNQSSSEFWKLVAYKLIHDFECLIIQTDNGYLYVADSFDKGDYQLNETYFKNVVINIYDNDKVNEYRMQGTFKGDRAIYIKYANKGALNLVRQMSSLYAELIENVKLSGSNKLKYLLKIDTQALQGVSVDYDKELKKIINEDFKALVSDNHAIMPVLKGFDLDVLNPSNANAQNASAANSSIKSIYEELMVNVGQIYNVPRSFMLGTYEENDMDDFLTFGLDPWCDLIGEALNRKYYGKKAYMDGTYCLVDTKKIKHFDILTVSNAINKLISSGVYTINELRKILEEKPIDAKIGDLHWITRNYAVVGDYINEQSNYANGGEEIENE